MLGFYEYAFFRFGSDTLLCSGEQMRSTFDNEYKNVTPEQRLSADQWIGLLGRYHVDVTQLAPYLDDFRFYDAEKKQRRPENLVTTQNVGIRSKSGFCSARHPDAPDTEPRRRIGQPCALHREMDTRSAARL